MTKQDSGSEPWAELKSTGDPPVAPRPADRPTPPAPVPSADEPRSGADDSPRPRHGNWRLLASYAVVALVVVGLAAGLIISRRQLSDRDAADQARSSALAAAQTYAVDLASYDYQHLDKDFGLVATHSTGSFKDQFQKASATLKPLIIQYKGSAKAVVHGAGVVVATTDKATIVMFVDQTVTNTNSPTPRVDRNRVTMTLVQQGGQWLISQVDLV